MTSDRLSDNHQAQVNVSFKHAHTHTHTHTLSLSLSLTHTQNKYLLLQATPITGPDPTSYLSLLSPFLDTVFFLLI